MMLLAQQQMLMMNRGDAANKSQFGALQTAPISHPQFNRGLSNAPLKASQKTGPINNSQFQQPQSQQLISNKRKENFLTTIDHFLGDNIIF
jgi:hypothetical protein